MQDKKQVFQSNVVQHAAQCYDAQCMCNNPAAHIVVFVFETQDTIYCAATLNDAAQMWIDGGKQPLVGVGSQ